MGVASIEWAEVAQLDRTWIGPVKIIESYSLRPVISMAG